MTPDVPATRVPAGSLIPRWLVIVAWLVAFLMFAWWVIGRLMLLVLAWLAFSSIGGICAAESRKMRRSRH